MLPAFQESAEGSEAASNVSLAAGEGRPFQETYSETCIGSETLDDGGDWYPASDSGSEEGSWRRRRGDDSDQDSASDNQEGTVKGASDDDSNDSRYECPSGADGRLAFQVRQACNVIGGGKTHFKEPRGQHCWRMRVSSMVYMHTSSAKHPRGHQHRSVRKIPTHLTKCPSKHRVHPANYATLSARKEDHFKRSGC